MDRKGNLFKFLFLLLIALILFMLAIYSLVGSKQEEIEQDGWLDVESVEEKVVVETTIPESYSESSSTMKKEEPTDEFESDYIEKYGKKSVQSGKDISRKVVIMWLEQETDQTKWKPYATSSFLAEIEKEMLNVSDGIIRKVKKIKVYVVPLSEDEDGDIKYEVDVNWTYSKTNKGEVLGKQSRVYYVTLTSISNEGEWQVKELIQL